MSDGANERKEEGVLMRYLITEGVFGLL